VTIEGSYVSAVWDIAGFALLIVVIAIYRKGRKRDDS
jgi:hypothetical protein